MEFENENADLTNIANGEAMIHFLKHLNGAVIENIYDAKTSESECREINLKIKVRPEINPDAGERRSSRVVGLNFSVESSCKLAKYVSGAHGMHTDYDDEGRPVVVKHDPSQVSMFSEMTKLNQPKQVVEE